ncbi:hypothetical protein G6F22_020357 [Rhizopus arrhizus]|nr:hypothetical protein G6F22_020357 [Rhizopus arrhizus]
MHPHHRARLAGCDQAHGPRRAHQEMVGIQPAAAMPVGVDQIGPGQRARGDAHQRLLPGAGVLARCAHVLNSGISGLAPHMQNDDGTAGKLRGRWVFSSSALISLTPVE